jgi:hypothetical protein
MNNREILIQQRLLGLIQDQIPDKYSLVYELSELLGISSDSVYRRLRGETLLNIIEIQELCLHFNISFDSICGLESTGMASFRYSPIKRPADFMAYLVNMRDVLKGIKKRENVHITYAAIDIPVLHNFRFPLVSSFKSFYWLKSIADLSDFQEIKFSSNVIRPELIEMGKEISDLYCSIPSTEIWTDLILNSLLKQIDYYYDTGEFNSPADALDLLDDVEKEFEYMQAAARNNSKNPDLVSTTEKLVNFRVYYCEIEIANNCVLLSDKSGQSVILSTHTFNTLVTSNGIFVEETQRWLDGLMEKSTLISGVGEKQRNIFFRNAHDKIALLRQKIAL